ncbi:MAG TPA: DUF424 family protein [Nanoarchaeota archaeon]|nr:DUF424 family protein [Nanoarchaeota archaeon]
MRGLWCKMSGKTTQIKKEFYFKIYNRGNEIVLAVCDKDILGKKVEENEIVLYAKPEFYKGEEIGEEVIELFERASIINLMGKKIVALALKHGLIEKNSILEIKGVAHAQIIKM